jgi:drug/metabolite transporter (DMT)-like permease
MNSQAVRLALGVTLALAAAATFGIASILQHRAARRAPKRAAGRPRLLVDLLHDRRWRLSIVLTTLAFTFQVAALKLLPLLFVQPLLVTGLLWYVVGSALSDRRRPDLVLVLASVGCLAGLSTMLLVAHPTTVDGAVPASLLSALPLVLTLAGIVVGCLILTAVIPVAYRSLPLALASGVCYGVTAGLVRSLSSYFSDGPLTVFAQWQTYAIAVLGPLGVLLSQNAYQSGRLGSPALAIITVTDPIVSVAVGMVWLGESVSLDTADLIGEAIALCVLLASVFLLAERAPHVPGEEVADAEANGSAARESPGE